MSGSAFRNKRDRFVLRHEQHLRRAADAKPGQFGERLVGQQAAAQLRHRAFSSA
jgi:hypothetical protein